MNAVEAVPNMTYVVTHVEHGLTNATQITILILAQCHSEAGVTFLVCNCMNCLGKLC